MNNNEQQETVALVAQAMEDFRQGMEYRGQPGIRIGRRTMQIIRCGMDGLSIPGLILFYLVLILARDFSQITPRKTALSGYMNSMEQEFASVAGTVSDVRKTRLLVNENISVMPAMGVSVRSMDTGLAALNTGLHAMLDRIRHMNGSVAGMAGSIQVMNNQINNMNMTIGNMGENIRQLAKPVKASPF